MPSLKQTIYNCCMTALKKDINAVEEAIANMRETIANETKSSAGDKYETTREMLQQEVNRELARTREMQKMKATLESINPQSFSKTINRGSLVRTNNGNFYIAISATKQVHEGQTFHPISDASPLGRCLMGKGVGSKFEFRAIVYIVNDVA